MINDGASPDQQEPVRPGYCGIFPGGLGHSSNGLATGSDGHDRRRPGAQSEGRAGRERPFYQKKAFLMSWPVWNRMSSVARPARRGQRDAAAVCPGGGTGDEMACAVQSMALLLCCCTLTCARRSRYLRLPPAALTLAQNASAWPAAANQRPLRLEDQNRSSLGLSALGGGGSSHLWLPHLSCNPGQSAATDLQQPL